MTKDQVQELLMGAALVALGYALYRHFKPVGTATVSDATISASDQAAIETAIGSGSDAAPPIYIPAPIPINGTEATGYTADVPSDSWLTQIEDMLKGAL